MDVLTAWMRCPIPVPKPVLELVFLCQGYPSGNGGLLGRSFFLNEKDRTLGGESVWFWPSPPWDVIPGVTIAILG